MKIGILSDSHDRMRLLERAMEFFRDQDLHFLIHAGDFISPFAVRAALDFPGRVVGVFGNNDGEKRHIRQLWSDVHEGSHRLELAGRSILVNHHVGWIAPEEWEGIDVAIYGHTHQKKVERVEGVLHINPGEVCAYLTGVCSVATLDLESLEAEIHILEEGLTMRGIHLGGSPHRFDGPPS